MEIEWDREGGLDDTAHCGLCGAVVPEKHQALHEEWHRSLREELSEVIERIVSLRWPQY